MNMIRSQVKELDIPINHLATTQACVINKTKELLGRGKEGYPARHIPGKMVFKLEVHTIRVTVQFLKGQRPFIPDLVPIQQFREGVFLSGGREIDIKTISLFAG
jgi:hypothetical protein